MTADAPSGYVVDINVLSNRGDVKANPALSEWLQHYASLVRISVITAAEMHRSLLLLEAKVAALSDRRVKAREHLRASARRAWYTEVTRRFADRLELIDLAVAEKWAEVSVRFPSLRDADKAIAATVLARGYGVATENIGDFRRTGVRLVNPFDRATWDEDWDDDPLLRRMGRRDE